MVEHCRGPGGDRTYPVVLGQVLALQREEQQAQVQTALQVKRGYARSLMC